MQQSRQHFISYFKVIIKFSITQKNFFKSGFPPPKAEQSLQVMKLQQKNEKDEKDIRKLFRKNPKRIGVY